MLGKLQKEGDACGIVRDEDHWGQMLTERTSRVDSWLAEAQKVVKELTVMRLYILAIATCSAALYTSFSF